MIILAGERRGRQFLTVAGYSTNAGVQAVRVIYDAGLINGAQTLAAVTPIEAAGSNVVKALAESVSVVSQIPVANGVCGDYRGNTLRLWVQAERVTTCDVVTAAAISTFRTTNLIVVEGITIPIPDEANISGAIGVNGNVRTGTARWGPKQSIISRATSIDSKC